MTRQELVAQIFSKDSYLCVGLDTDKTKLPTHLQNNPDGVFLFNKAIIDATKNFCVGYKINTAFYEAEGLKGWETMQRTVDYIPSTHFKIADAKRGDIGNTSAQYAKAFFETMNFDAVTVAPYMGEDSVRPFLEYKNKWTILLGLTSNTGAKDFELQKLVVEKESLVEGIHTVHRSESFLYEKVLQTSSGWGSEENLMFVIGATQAEEFTNVRRLIPRHFYLVPGVGAQGGSLKDISEKALIEDCGLLVNASRAVIYASSGEDFAEAAANAAKAYADEMKAYLQH
ncbi:orotidine-5'-phosphate decarboxylase [Flavisolibacter ginsenosidimutans]|uniref:Orotidine-5'-phosphate decarboxylase n=2 Tax=Flavisolibacter ginsenosidimutans TaxID=661481 RepID=A0A5B8UP23_9BACT|nr:orotidine-5'-phosphate decarboxylase [Flavisolibacter ginsenosidimutans]